MGISSKQYSKIMTYYDDLQTQERVELDKKTELIFSEHPDIKAIQNNIIALSVSSAKHLLTIEDPNEMQEFSIKYKQKLSTLSTHKNDLLKQYGYPDNYLEPSYKCNLCHDTGYINNKPCQCFNNLAIKMLYSSSNLGNVLKNENFSTFNFDYYDNVTKYDDNRLPLTPYENIKRIYNVCLDFTKNFDEVFDNFLFYGETGVGKTFLTHCIAKALLDTSHTVVYLSSIQLFELLEQEKFHSGNNSTDISYIKNCQLLIIDDLGTELSNSFTDSQLYNIINMRILSQLSTVISTNLSFAELRQRYSDRIFSRFTGYYNFCWVVGDDIRSIK